MARNAHNLPAHTPTSLHIPIPAACAAQDFTLHTEGFLQPVANKDKQAGDRLHACTSLYLDLLVARTALHCTALHCTALHCIALHCTALTIHHGCV
jgi:hypothetical protein